MIGNVGRPEGWRQLTLGAIRAHPSRITLAGPVCGAAGTVVGAGAELGAVLPEASSGTHCGHRELGTTCCPHLPPHRFFRSAPWG